MKLATSASTYPLLRSGIAMHAILALHLSAIAGCTKSKSPMVQPSCSASQTKDSSGKCIDSGAAEAPPKPLNASEDVKISGNAVEDVKINGNAVEDVKINSSRGVPAAGGTNSDGSAVIAAGSHAPYKAAPAGYSAATVQQWATAHKARVQGDKYYYVYVPPETVSDKDLTNVLRVAAGKAWNHLSWLTTIEVPEDISDGAGLAFALNATKLWGGDAETNWGYIARCAAKDSIQISPAATGRCDTFDAAAPVPIPRFVYNAVNGGPYANIHQTPPDYGSFQDKFQLGPLLKVSTHREAIVCGPRIVGYRNVSYKGQNLIYAFSSDEFDGRDNGSISYTNAPTEDDQRSTGAFNAAPGDGNTAVASEWWMQLPNGFLYWGIHGEGSQERGRAEVPFAIDPANFDQDNELSTGRSCITCHASGVHAAKSDVEFAGKNGWTSNEDLDAFYKTIRDRFQNSLRQLTAGLSDGGEDLNGRIVGGTIEPVAKAIMMIEGSFRGGNDCSFFCNGKYGPQRQNLCETLPTR